MYTDQISDFTMIMKPVKQNVNILFLTFSSSMRKIDIMCVNNEYKGAGNAISL